MNILFVCTGNTCRSPMAEALAKDLIPEINVQSAGVFASKNSSAAENAVLALREREISLTHQSQSVTAELIKWADVVLTMTTQHKQSLAYHYPKDLDKYFTLKEYVADVDNKVETQIKKAYVALEEKKLQFIQENERKWKQEELEENVARFLYDDVVHLRQLEESLQSYDIIDPFGGDLTIYVETCNELAKNIKLLKRKILKVEGDE